MGIEAIREEAKQRQGACHDARLDWWREAKFGLFVHWGIYAVAAGRWKGRALPGVGEWIMSRARIPVADYEKLATQFNPVEFDAAEWVSLAKRAGQKYFIITSKHHDGFCLFKSHVTDYSVVDGSPFKRDPLKDLAAECEKQGLKFGFYYSQTQDWHHPNGHGNDWDYDGEHSDFSSYLEDYVKPQVRELLSNYGPIGVIWFDTPMVINAEQSQSLLDLCRELQPDCLVSGRVGNSLGDYGSTRDNEIPGELVDFDWETPATINDTWGYKADDVNWKSSKDLIHKLVDIVSKGGNYLLNVGPTAQGIIPQPSVERLLAMGGWLEINGEAIYGTKPGPIRGQNGYRSTIKGSTTYLHVFEWPKGGEVEIPRLDTEIARVFLLADPSRESLPFTRAGDRLIIKGPAEAPDRVDTVIALVSEV